MQYREKLIELIFETEDHEAYFEWVSAHPILDRVDILKEFKDILQEIFDTTGDDSLIEIAAEMEKIADEYQEIYLEQQLIAIKYELAIEDRDRLLKKLERMREYIRKCIETNAPNAEEMKELAIKMIESDKKDESYDPANWNWFLDGN
jgi:hypothetical protein